MKYEVIFERDNYALILRKKSMDEYAVVYGLNRQDGTWLYTVNYWYFGQCSLLNKIESLQKAIDCFRLKTEDNYITRSRLEELASKFSDGLIEDDKESAMEYFIEECEMEDYEMEFFGIEMEDGE